MASTGRRPPVLPPQSAMEDPYLLATTASDENDLGVPAVGRRPLTAQDLAVTNAPPPARPPKPDIVWDVEQYHHGNVDRTEAEARLREATRVLGSQVCFLVRDRARTAEYVLSVARGDNIAHLVIGTDPEGVSFTPPGTGERQQCSSISQLIERLRDPQSTVLAYGPLQRPVPPSSPVRHEISPALMAAAGQSQPPEKTTSKSSSKSNGSRRSKAEPSAVNAQKKRGTTDQSLSRDNAAHRSSCTSAKVSSEGGHINRLKESPSLRSHHPPKPKLFSSGGDASQQPEEQFISPVKPHKQRSSTRSKVETASTSPKVETEGDDADSLPSMADFATTMGRQMAAPTEEEKVDDEYLIAEGPLEKNRGLGQSRIRWFRLTSLKLTYYTKEAGETIATVNVSDISHVSDLEGHKMRIITQTPFGSGNHLEMVVEAANRQVKNKWYYRLKGEEHHDQGGGSKAVSGRLLTEGPLLKVAKSGMNQTRWFMLTTRRLSYFKEEAGERMADLAVQNILAISSEGDRGFRVLSNERFTVGGQNEISVRADSEAVRNK